MNRPISLCVIVAAVTFANFPQAKAQDEADSLLGKIASGSYDVSTVYALDGQPLGPRTLPGLRAAFAIEASKDRKQSLAVVMLHLGEKDEKY